jgi:hypothetical protein
MTRRSVFAIGSRLLLGETLGGSLKPRAETGIDVAAGRLDRGELRMAKRRGLLGRVMYCPLEKPCPRRTGANTTYPAGRKMEAIDSN